MNNAHRSVWNETTRTWVAAPENANARSKGTARKIVRAIARAAVMIGLVGAASVASMPDFALAAPSPSPIPGLPTGSPSGANGNAGTGTGNPGLWVNDGTTGGCIVAYDAASGSGGGTGNQWYGINNSYGSKYLAGCDATGALGAGAYNNQTNRVLFYGQGTGATSLSLGGDLFANAGDFGLGGGQTGDSAGSMRIGGLPTLAGNSGLYALAIGGSATAATVASADNSIAIGTAGTASATNAVALGTSATASASQGVALGANSQANRAGMNGATEAFSNAAVKSSMGAVSVGDVGSERQITNVAGGTSATDAVNLRQLQAVSDASLKYDTNGDGTVNYNSITLNKGGSATTITNVANGVNPGDAVNMSQLDTTNNNVTNLGDQVNNLYDTGTKYFHANSTGTDSTATGTDSVAIGTGAAAMNADDVALGAGSSTSTTVATTGATIGGTTYGFAGTNPSSTVSVGSAGHERTITNVAAGRLDSASTDAVNGSQLYATNSAVNQNATNIAQNTTDITNLQDGMADAVTYDSSAHDSVTLGGTTSTSPVHLHNVAAGDVSSTSTDAVNGSQLYATNQTVTQNTNDINNLQDNVTNLGDQVNDIYTTGTKYFHANSTGTDSTATGVDSVAIGMGAVANNDNDVALGAGSSSSKAVGTPGATIAGTSYTFAGSAPVGTVSVGALNAERTITNVAAGSLNETSTDAVNGSQLYATNQAVSSLTQNTADADKGNVKYDHNTDGSIDYSSVTLAGAVSTDGGMTGGTTITNVHQGKLNATSTDAVNGSQLYATNQNVAQNTTDIANLSTNINNGGIGLVQQDPASRNITVAKDTDGARVDFTSSSSGARQLTGVADGVVGPASLYAINGSQLYGVSSSIANSIGGGMVVNNDGSVSMPTFNVGGKSYHTVNDAITNLDGRVTNVENVVNNSSPSGVTDPGIVKQDATTGKITVGADTAGTTVDMTGTQGARTVTGVADGAVNADSSDAINGSQLYALGQKIEAQSATSFAQTNGDTLNQANAYTDQQVGAALQSANSYTDQQVDAARRDANAGTAAAMAMAALPQAVQNGRGMVAMGGSTYGGQSAVALGVSRMSDTGKWIFKGTLSTNTRGTFGVGIGAGRHF